MNGGSKLLATTAVLALAGCGSEGKLEIRAIPAPVSATAKPVPTRIAEANGYLAVGNVGLAVESFRKALREQPDSVDALVGLAASYDGMGRFDLARRYYEQALAIVPKDARVLTAFARSLDAQGRGEEAAAVRAEISIRLAAATPPPARVGPSVTIMLPPPQPAVATATVLPAKPLPARVAPVAGRSVTVKLPPAQPIPATEVRRPAKPLPAPAPAPADRPPPPPALPPVTRVAVAAAKPLVVPQPPQSAAPMEVKVAAAPVATPPALLARKKLEAAEAMAAVKPTPAIIAPKKVETAPARVIAPTAPLSPPVMVTRPTLAEAARPAAPVAVPAPAAPVPAPRPAAAPVAAPAVVARNILEAGEAATPAIAAPTIVERKVSAALPSPGSAPHLERMSPGEVALVTTGRPQWRSKIVARTAQSTTIRYVPLRKAEARPVQIRLLNAARQQGLAARTRAVLAQRGWRKLAIGDANRVRQTSLILYPANRRSMALRLSAQFGFPIAKRASGTELVMLIGRDATKRGVARTRA